MCQVSFSCGGAKDSTNEEGKSKSGPRPKRCAECILGMDLFARTLPERGPKKEVKHRTLSGVFFSVLVLLFFTLFVVY